MIVVMETVCAAFYLSLLGMNISNALLLYPVSVCVSIVFAIYASRSIQIPLNLSRDQMKKMADGDLVIDEKGLRSFGAEFEEFEKNFLTMIGRFSSIIATVQNSVETLASSTEEMSATSEEVNALSEEIAATIQQISRGSSTQSEMASRGVENVSEMSTVVDAALKDIENTLQVIDDIAGQTNILALNAAIEAARAGEYGRGFAVVADNVRRLAEETKTNAGDINVITTRIIKDVGNSLSGIQESFQNFAAQSEEFSASSEEVAAATEEESASMHQLVQSTQKLTRIADELNNEIKIFRIKE
jgi:methyl-accepting chemotaxis protein